MADQQELPVQPQDKSITASPHSNLEDVYAIIVGSTLVLTGLMLLKTAGLVTGGIAGIALLLSYHSPLGVGLLFALINLPFFVFGWKVMGARFLIKTLAVNAIIAAVAAYMPMVLEIAAVHPGFAALGGGTIIGMGVLALARHGAGVGGIGVMTLWLYKTRGWNAGRIQIAIDMLIVFASALLLPIDRLLWSAVSVFAINGIIAVWHRPGRYTGH